MSNEEFLKRRVTIYQVAKESGYSLATVSRVINNKDNVTEETKRKINETIERLGYKPSAIAQGLAKSKTTTIGIVIPSNLYTYVASMLSGMVDIAKIYGYQTVLFVTSEQDDVVNDVLERVISSNVDGAVVFDDQLSNEDIARLTHYSIPVAVIGRDIEGENVASVPLIYENAINEIIKHHFEETNDDVYFLQIPHAGALMSSIQRSVEKACADMNKTEKLHVLEVEDSYSKTYAQFLEWFKQHKKGCYIAPRDSISCGVLNAANESDISVPNDVEILSVIGTKYSTIARPSLTSLDIDMYEVGSIAMRMLTKLLTNSLKVRVFPFNSSIHYRCSTKFR